MDPEKYVNIIKKKLSPARADHSLRVRETAVQMADRLGADREKTAIAGLLHDYAKDTEHGLLLETAERNGLFTCEAERAQPDLLHGPVGAWLCREELGIRDEEILRAVSCHTTGRAGMKGLDVIIYLADLIEPGRSFKGVEDLRAVCGRDIYAGLLLAFDRTLRYVIDRRMLIHPHTVEARNWLLTFKR